MDDDSRHFHRHPPPAEPAERPLSLAHPLLALSGQLRCRSLDEVAHVRELLDEHAALSRAEPGNLRFDCAPAQDPLAWDLHELYADESAFEAHRKRLRASRWGRESHGIARDFRRDHVTPVIRAESGRDHSPLAALLTRAFGGSDEARLVERLRADGDLALSLVASAADTLLGHVALSPLTAEGPALALAPLAVHPALQGRGIGTALMRAALAAFPRHAIVVLGDPAYYRRFGFRPADLDSTYAGPHLMILGPKLPAGSRIDYAPAFAAI